MINLVFSHDTFFLRYIDVMTEKFLILKCHLACNKVKVSLRIKSA